MKLHRYVDHQRLHIVTKDVISLSISVLLLFRHYISHKITFGAPSSGGVLRSACGAFIPLVIMLNSLSLVVYFKISMVVENSNSIQVRQQCFGCNYTKFELTIPIFLGCVLNFRRVSNFWPTLL